MTFVVTKPVQPLARAPVARVARRKGMSGFVAAPWLQTWPDGQPLSKGNFVSAPACQSFRGSTTAEGLAGFVDAPWFTHWTDGRPIPSPGGSYAKKDLVVLAFHRATAKKAGGRRRRRGLGDDSYDVSTIDESLPAGFDTSSVDVSAMPSDVPTIDTPVTSSLPYQPTPSYGNVMTSTAGVPTSVYPSAPGQTQAASNQATAMSFLAPLLNALGVKSVGGTPTSPLAYQATGTPISTIGSFTNSLAQKPFAGSPLSYGGYLLAGGVVILLVSVMGGKRRR